jgi:glucose/arabinose dehydrogenase/mono/diheme cytochrome c family protein
MIKFRRTACLFPTIHWPLIATVLFVQLCTGASAWAEDELAVRLQRGKDLYFKNCFVCHQISGQGIPGAFPPLAKSDYLTNDVERSIRAVCEGLSGEIVVNGRKYSGAMPPAVIDDAEVADVFTFVLNSWGNPGGKVSADTVRQVRAKTAFPTLERLKKASTYPPLPVPPDGFTLREVVRLPHKGVRLASDGEGKILFVLTEHGDLWQLETENGSLRQVLWAKRYLEKRPGDIGGPLFVLGMTMDKQKRLYIASNQQNKDTLPPQNIVTIYRTTSVLEGDPAEPKPWFQTNYPGSPAYIHGVEHIAFGPDGFLYAGNGARTDGGLTSSDPNWYGGGETPITACLWRIDPKAETPALEIFARGIRNAYGFCWNDHGEMFATENGPDADAPEELNFIERGRHYGFPYTYANWTKKAYARTPDPSPGLEFTLPIPNLGPDGGFAGEPIYSFDPHSGPGGIVFLGGDFPDGYRGTFLLTRFGNFIRTPKDNVGFDVLQAKLSRNAAGTYEARIHTVLAPLGRPIDIHLGGRGKVYICEYSRPMNSAASYALPGRVLELSVKSGSR